MTIDYELNNDILIDDDDAWYYAKIEREERKEKRERNEEYN